MLIAVPSNSSAQTNCQPAPELDELPVELVELLELEELELLEEELLEELLLLEELEGVLGLLPPQAVRLIIARGRSNRTILRSRGKKEPRQRAGVLRMGLVVELSRCGNGSGGFLLTPCARRGIARCNNCRIHRGGFPGNKHAPRVCERGSGGAAQNRCNWGRSNK